MIPVPAGWLQAADRTHAPAWEMTAYTFDRGTLTGTYPLPLTGGVIAKHAHQYPRTTLQATVPAAGSPAPAPAELLPYGTQVRLRYRVDGGPWATIAHLHLLRSVIRRPGGEWSLEAVDGSGLVADDAICPTRPAPALAGLTILQAVSVLIRRTLPAAVVTGEGAAAGTLVPAGWEVVDASPWRAVEILTGLVGATVAVDPASPYGFHVRPVNRIGAPVDELRVGGDGTVTGYRVFHERAWNSVSVRFTDPDNLQSSVWGWWQDDRPDSRLNPARLGHHVTLTRTLEGTPTQAQADAVAASIGLREAGYARTSEYIAVDRPWLEPGDTVRMVTLATAQDVLVSGVRVPLDHGGMSVDLDNPNFVLDPPVMMGVS